MFGTFTRKSRRRQGLGGTARFPIETASRFDSKATNRYVLNVKFAAAVATLIASLLTLPAHAQETQQPEGAGFVRPLPLVTVAQQAALVNRDSAAALVRSATGGRVLGVRTASGDGKTVYHVKVLLQGGHVRIVRVDAQTGQLLD